MKLMTELVEDVQYLVEESGGKKNVYIVGPFIQTERENRNGRIYRLPVMEREIARYKKEYVDTGRALGELGHPNGPSINLDRVSHKIVSLEQNGNDFMGKALVLETPMGNIARNLIENDVTLGVSTRGMGSLKQSDKGIMEVQDDFHLATAADIVADPSAPDAFVRGIMEGVEWIWDNGILKAQKLEEAKREIEKSVGTKRFGETQLKIFEQLMNVLANGSK